MTLREIRALNYRVKRRENFRCSEEGCKATDGLLVVRIGDGEDDASFTTTCTAHRDGRPYNPGQWITRPGEEDEAVEAK